MSNLFQSKTQTQTTTNQAPSYALPGLKQLANDTMSLYNSGQGYAQFPGSSVAPLSSQTQGGINALTANAQNANDPSSQLYGSVGNGLLGLSNSGGMNATQNDAIAKMNDLYNNNDANFQSSLDFQNQKIADAVNRQFQGMGAYGGTDYAKALTGELAGNTAQALSNQFNQSQALKSGIANNLFSAGQQGINNQQGIAGLLPGLQQARDYNANQLLGAGSLVDTNAQNKLNDTINRFNTAQSAQRQRISDATGLLSGVVGDYGTKSTAAPGASTFQQVLGGGLGGLGLLGALLPK